MYPKSAENLYFYTANVKRVVRVLMLLTSLLAACASLFGQGSTGRIDGTVTDQSGPPFRAPWSRSPMLNEGRRAN